eukprot:8020891-Pyramimonas_sp.AAC.1
MNVLTSGSYRWTAAIDFKKAFDCVDHGCLWEALRQQHIQSAYINFLKHLYRDQTATVRTDATSRPCSIERGVEH